MGDATAKPLVKVWGVCNCLRNSNAFCDVHLSLHDFLQATDPQASKYARSLHCRLAKIAFPAVKTLLPANECAMHRPPAPHALHQPTSIAIHFALYLPNSVAATDTIANSILCTVTVV